MLFPIIYIYIYIYTECLKKKQAPFSKINCGRSYRQKTLNFWHKVIQLINKKFLNFLYPIIIRFFSTSVFPKSSKSAPVRSGWVQLWIKISHFSIFYNKIHIHRQRNVEFNISYQIQLKLMGLFTHSPIITSPLPHNHPKLRWTSVQNQSRDFSTSKS